MADANRSRRAGIVAMIVVAVSLVVVLWSACGPEPQSAVDGTARQETPASDAQAASAPRPRKRTREPDPATSGEVPTAASGADAAAIAAPATTGAKEPAPTFEVIVIRADGAPAAGAEVMLSGESPFGDRVEKSVREVAGADGRARLPFPTDVLTYARLGAEAGWARPVRLAKELESGVEIRLRPGPTVRGRTVDALGVPVKGAKVRVTMEPAGSGARLVIETASADDGAFETPPLPFDDRVSGGSDSILLVATATDHVPGKATTSRKDAPTRPVVLTLDRGGVLSGRLVLPDGRPARSAMVWLAGSNLLARSGDDGRFAIRIPRSGGEIVVHDRIVGFVPGEPLPEARAWVAPRRLGTIRGDADADFGDVKLGEASVVRGVVVTGNDEPVPSARVTVAVAGVQVGWARSDHKGEFEMLLGSDECELSSSDLARDGIWTIRRGTLRGVRGGDTGVRLVLGGLGVVVRLRDEVGAKIAGRVDLLSVMGSLRGHPAGGTSGTSMSGTGLEDVRIEFTQAGAWDVKVEATGYETALVEAVDVRADRDAEVEVRLRRKP